MNNQEFNDVKAQIETLVEYLTNFKAQIDAYASSTRQLDKSSNALKDIADTNQTFVEKFDSILDDLQKTNQNFNQQIDTAVDLLLDTDTTKTVQQLKTIATQIADTQSAFETLFKEATDQSQKLITRSEKYNLDALDKAQTVIDKHLDESKQEITTIFSSAEDTFVSSVTKQLTDGTQKILARHDVNFDKVEKSNRRVATALESLDNKLTKLDKSLSSFDNLNAMLDALDTKITKLDQKLDNLDQSLHSLDKKFDNLDQSLHSLDKKFNTLTNKFDEESTKKRGKSLFRRD